MYGLERGVSWPGMEVRRNTEHVMEGGEQWDMSMEVRSTERVVGGGEQWEGNVEEKQGAGDQGPHLLF